MSQELRHHVNLNFESGLEGLQAQFIIHAKACFGGGWVWLVDNKTELQVISTIGGESPLVLGPDIVPVLGLDVWEHSYWFDHESNIEQYVQEWFKVVNWDFVARNLAQVQLEYDADNMEMLKLEKEKMEEEVAQMRDKKDGTNESEEVDEEEEEEEDTGENEDEDEESGSNDGMTGSEDQEEGQEDQQQQRPQQYQQQQRRPQQQNTNWNRNNNGRQQPQQDQPWRKMPPFRAGE